MVVAATLRLLPEPSRRQEVLEVLRSIRGHVLAQPGCAGFRIYEEQDAEQAIVLAERWETQAALDAHLRSENFLRVLGAIELSSAPPGVLFDYITATGGMEVIQRARGPDEKAG